MSGGTKNPRDTDHVPDPSVAVETAKKAVASVRDTLVPAVSAAVSEAKERLEQFDPQKKEERCVFFLKWGEIAVSRFIAAVAVVAWILDAMGYDIDTDTIDRVMAFAGPAVECPPVECICEVTPPAVPPEQ